MTRYNIRNLSFGGLQNFAEGYKGRVDTCVVELDCIFSAKKELHYVFSLALQFDNEKKILTLNIRSGDVFNSVRI